MLAVSVFALVLGMARHTSFPFLMYTTSRESLTHLFHVLLYL